MWAMVTFFAALSCLFFIGTTFPTRLAVSVVEVFVVGLIIWCIIVGGKKQAGTVSYPKLRIEVQKSREHRVHHVHSIHAEASTVSTFHEP